MLDSERFKSAAARAIEETKGGFQGVGRPSEKVMHRALKLYYEPDETYHEVECLGMIADVMNSYGITEIQRSSFSYMVPKLRRYLPEHRVRLVHPIAVKKRVRWLDRETGEITDSGRTVRGKRVQDAAFEIFKIREFIGNRNFELVILLLDCDDYRALDGWDTTGKKGATRLECIPRELLGEIILREPRDYLSLLPDGLGDEFTEKEYRTAIRSTSRYSYYLLRLLVELSLLDRRREGKKYVYKRK